MTDTKISRERQTNAELVAQLRRLVDDQEGGDAVVLVQRQLFNRVVGRLAETLASRHQEPVNEPVVTNPMIFAAMSRADELGIPMSDWQANSILTASLQKQESGDE